MCSEVIGKIIEKKVGMYIAIAEGIEYRLYSSKSYNIGDYVLGYVMSYDEDEDTDDENEFYMEDSNRTLCTESEWLEQEEHFK